MNQVCTTDYPKLMLLQMEIRRMMAQGLDELEILQRIADFTTEEDDEVRLFQCFRPSRKRR